MKTYFSSIKRIFTQLLFTAAFFPLLALAVPSYSPTVSLNPTLSGSPILRDGYGLVVKTNGDYVYVSAPFTRPAGLSNIVAGAVYVYKKSSSGSYDLIQTIVTNGGSDHVGANQIRAEGKWLMISAIGTPIGPMTNDDVTNQDFKGAVLIYNQNSSGTYDLVQTIDSNTPGLEGLTAADPATFDPNNPLFIFFEQGASFGLYFDLDAANKELLVGAQYQASSGIKNSGAVYSFHLNTSSNKWELDQVITSPAGPTDTDAFGSHVEIKGDVALISNAPILQFPKFGPFAANSSVYVYNKINGQWVNVQTLHGDQTTTPNAITFFATLLPIGDGFGAALSIDKNKALVGAPMESNNPFINSLSGAVYAYDVVTGSDGKKTLNRTQKIVSDDVYSIFTGFHVAIDGNTIVIGDPGRKGPNAFYQGGVMVLSRNSQNQYVQTQTLYSATGQMTDFFGVGVDIGNGRIVVGGAPIIAAIGPKLGLFIQPSPTYPPLLPIIPFPQPSVVIYEK